MNRKARHPPNPESVAAQGGLISSTQNPRVKQAVKLRQRSHRDEAGLLLIEGHRELKRALDNRRWPISIFYCEEFFTGTHEPKMIQQCRDHGVQVFNCTPAVFRKMAYRDRPEGIIAIASQVKRKLNQVTLSRQPLVIVAESIEKPGNLGTILRSADAAGADAVIVCDHCTDTHNPNVVRTSIGTLFSVPVIETSSQEAIAWLRQHHIQILAATPHAEKEYTDADLRPGVAIVVGTEHHGLSDLWMNEADLKVCVPMHGQADSLNVAAAATILLFEALRQRKQGRL